MSVQTALRMEPAAGDLVTGLRRILANAVSLLLAWALPRLLAVLAVIVAARVLGTAGFGQYGTAAAFAIILSILATLGMQPLLIREMAADPAAAPGWLRAAHRLKLASNLAMLALLLGLGLWVFDYQAAVLQAAFVLAVGHALAAWAENYAAWFQSVERMDVWMKASTAGGLTTAVLGVILVLATQSVVWFCAAYVAGQLVVLGSLARRLPAPIRRRSAEAAAPLGRLLRALAPFAAGFIALTIYSKVDVLLLARWWPATEVGLYAAAYKFTDIVQALAVVGAAAVYPRLSRSQGGSAAMRLIEITLLCGVLAAGTLWLARDTLVPAFFGRAYFAAVPAAGLLAIGLAPLAINIVSGYVLAAAGQMRAVAGLYVAAVVLRLALNLAWVPAGGAAGSAAAMLTSEVALALGMTLVLARRTHALPRGRVLAGALLAGLVAFGAGGLPWPGESLVRAGLFAAAAALLFTATGALSRNDRALLLAALRPARGARGP